MRILVIEDEEPLAAVVKEGLEAAGYSVDAVADGCEGLERARDEVYSLIVLDLMLPGLDGWRVCEALRSKKDTTPLLMLTARDTVEDRVKGLELGADDYLPKPFDFKELRARVQALLRRDRMHKARVIRVADLEIDTGLRRVRRGDRDIALTQREYTLLEALAANEGRILTRDVILERIWMDEESFSNTVDVHIGVLRKKLDQDGKGKLIHTVHGVGYVLRSPEWEDGE